MSKQCVSTYYLIGCLLATLGTSSVCDAQTLHHYRFEDNQFLVDSAGSADLTSGSVAISQVSLPDGTRGQDFPQMSVGFASNDSGADFTQSVATDGLFTTSSTPISGDLTIEAFIHPDTIAPVGVANQIASQGNSGGASGFSWIFALAGTISNTPGDLALSFSDGSTVHPVSSGIILSPDTDYYVAASIDLTGGEVTFFAQDLTAGTPLQQVTKTHAATALHPRSRFQIGDYNSFSDSAFDGLIDEVRLSGNVLPQNQLLISIPEPSTFGLLALAIAAIALRIPSRRR